MVEMGRIYSTGDTTRIQASGDPHQSPVRLGCEHRPRERLDQKTCNAELFPDRTKVRPVQALRGRIRLRRDQQPGSLLIHARLNRRHLRTIMSPQHMNILVS